MPFRTFLPVVATLACLVALGAGSLPANNSISLVYTAAPDYDLLAWMRGADRFPRGADLYLRDAQGARRLAPDFAASADASVSFDASYILFAGKKKAKDPWQVWELALQDGSLRRITHTAFDCVRPLFVSPDQFVYAANVHGRYLIELGGLASAGDSPLQLTYGAGNSLPADILRDGRVLFESGFSLNDSAISEIYTVYTDGSGVESYRCDHGGSRYSARQLASGDLLFATPTGLARFTSALSHQVPVQLPAKEYAGDVTELPDGSWLLSARTNHKGKYALMKRQPDSNALQTEIDPAGANLVQPVLLAPRTVPNQHPSGLHGWSYANLLCLNAYTSKQTMRAGSIASVRLYSRSTSGSPELLGSASVEKDGSFYLRVPGDQPLQIELADKSGRTVRRESGWFWMRGGEQRVCTGCHAGPETAPENAVPTVLQKSIIPADMTRFIKQESAQGGR